eukprot:GHVU01228018.1.p3 GENE.GHVU01228018.1~~GHVU01228018.1.p3  ORF type:complete len:104 (+),score=3.79 GHVU01228018.1:313-624(+)
MHMSDSTSPTVSPTRSIRYRPPTPCLAGWLARLRSGTLTNPTVAAAMRMRPTDRPTTRGVHISPHSTCTQRMMDGKHMYTERDGYLAHTLPSFVQEIGLGKQA